ncbi:glycosyltransferase family 1 protein [Pseudonocardiaceae bacterium YIM PH 21723]|nr:glycosyltransferase family 1 protein [Pseudonocardiaceae bacterium YIM PH 21723]
MRTGDRPIRIASVPAGHVYVDHLSDPDGDDAVTRLIDPKPCGAPSGSARWWPPVMLDSDWVAAHHGEFDVFHLHFGFDAQSPADLADLAAALRRYGKPLVYTAHDLRNPHHRDQGPHRGQLDVLIPAADAVITLTPGAAQEIARGWGREAIVLPHPHVLPAAELGRSRPDRHDFVVGVHAKSLRPNMAPVPVIDALIEAISCLPGARVRVDLHTEVLDPDNYWHDEGVVGALRSAAEQGRIDLRVHDFFSDDELWAYLSGLDLSVLPYWSGTHSGWLEACFDVGTPVLAPDCGHYREQRPCLVYGHNDDGLDACSLVRAVHTAYQDRPVWQADPDERVKERRLIAAAHRFLYEELLS